MAIYIKDSAIRDLSLANNKIVNSTIEQTKLKDPYYTKTEVDNKIDTLNYTDTAVDGKYVASVSEANGKITVVREDLPNGSDNLNVTDTAVEGKYVTAVSETKGKISVTRSDLPESSTSKKGIIQLTDTYTATDSTKALTGKAVKSVLDNLNMTTTEGASTGMQYIESMKQENGLVTPVVKTFANVVSIAVDGKYVNAVSQTNGQISYTTADLPSVTDTAVADQYISKVDESKGKITVTRTKLPVKDVKLAGTSVVENEVAELKKAEPTETKFTKNADGTVNTQTKLEVATSKMGNLITGGDIATIKTYVDDKIEEELVKAGSGEMNVLEGVKVGGTALSITGKNVDIQLEEVKATGDNGIAKVELSGGKIKTTYDKFVESAATSGTTNQYAFFSGNNELTGKKLADGWAATSGATTSNFGEAAGTYTIPTTTAVHDYMDHILGGITGAMTFKGDALNIAAGGFNDSSVGWTYVVSAAGTYSGKQCGVGDMLIINSMDGGSPSWTLVPANTTVVNNGAEIGTTSTELGSINGTKITALVNVTTPTTCELTTSANTEIAKVAGKVIEAKLKESSTTYTAGSITGEGSSRVITYPKLEATNMNGVVTGADVADIVSYVTDYVDKKSTAAGSGEMNKVDDITVDGISVVAAKVAAIPNASTTKKGMVQLASAYSGTNTTDAVTGAIVKSALDDVVAGLDVSDTVDATKYVSGVSETDGKITVTRADLPSNTDAAVSGQYVTQVKQTNGAVAVTRAAFPTASTTATGDVQLASGYTDTDGAKALTGAAMKSTIDAIKKTVTDLDVTDTATAGKYVSAVSQADGKITVTRADLPSVTDTAAAGKYVSAVSETNGTISVSRESFPTASTTVAGIVKLNDDPDEGDLTTAPTSNFVAEQINSIKDTISTIHNNLDKTDTAVAGQYVSAVSETDGIISVTRAALPVKDVTVNGTSVVASGVAAIKKASTTELGVVKTDTALDYTTKMGTSGYVLNNTSETDDTVPTSKAVVTELAKMCKFWSGKQADYDAITTKDANTIYAIIPD